MTEKISISDRVRGGFHPGFFLSFIINFSLFVVAVFVKELKVRGIKKRADSKPKHDSKKRSEYEYILEVSAAKCCHVVPRMCSKTFVHI